MKLIYIANVNLPTIKAHGIQIVKMCEAFASVGFDVELVIPNLPNKIKSSIFEYYGVKENFKIKKVFSINFLKFNFLNKLMFILEYFSFSLGVFIYGLFNIKKFKTAEAIYIRDEIAPWVARIFNKNVFVEIHDFKPRYKCFKNFFKKGGLVLITENSKKDFIKIGISENRILLAPDAVDIDKFNLDIGKDEARKKLNLPVDKRMAIYTGHLFGWKGAQVLADAAKKSNNFLAVFVGGTEKDINNFKDKNIDNKNILILGQKPYSEIPYYLKAADILVLPNKKGSDLSEKYTSPLKLFEYMASKRPIVASDLKSIREVLNNKNSMLFEPDNPEDLVEKINTAINNEEKADEISNQAFSDVKQLTWINRAESIKKIIIR